MYWAELEKQIRFVSAQSHGNLVLEELSEINLCTTKKAHPYAEKTLHLLTFTNPKGTAEKNYDHLKALADWAKTWLVYRQN